MNHKFLLLGSKCLILFYIEGWSNPTKTNKNLKTSPSLSEA